MKIAVLGSVNMDMVVRVDRFPQPGETRTGTTFSVVPGGKGANQAVALGRLGADVAMAGRVGADAHGDAYLRNFRENGVDTLAVERVAGATTGVAVIEVEDAGENHIVIVPGANGMCDAVWLDRALSALSDRDIFLFQLEIPHATVFDAMRRLKAAGKTVILDPAPACALPDEVFRSIDYITPNETELTALTAELGAEADTPARMRALRKKGVCCVVAKCGADGVFLLSDAGLERAPGFPVKAVDTTAAGDTFNAGFACALSEGMCPRDAAVFANACAAISVTAAGAQGGMPTREAAERFLREREDRDA